MTTVHEATPLPVFPFWSETGSGPQRTVEPSMKVIVALRTSPMEPSVSWMVARSSTFSVCFFAGRKVISSPS